MKELSCTEAARTGFPTLMNRAAFGRERLILTRHGKPIAALVPIADLAELSRHEAQEGAQLEAGSAPEPQAAAPARPAGASD